MKFSKLSEYFARLEATASRNEITAILADLLKESSKDEIDKICYLSLGRLAPLYAGIEFNLAEKTMIKILATAYQKNAEEVKKQYKKVGDLGEVAESLDRKARGKPLEVKEVYERLYEVAMEAGGGSVERKISKMARLLDDLDAQSAKYVARIPVGKLRLGFSDLTILDALSWMIVGDKSKREEIEEAFNVRADIGQIAQIIKERGLGGLRGVKVSLGVPIMPALCQRLPTTEEIIKKAGPRVAVEPKLDGFRSQIHIFSEGGKKKIALFSRNLENTTPMFPEIVQAAQKLRVRSAILDGEAIGYNPKTGKFIVFQETMRRKRKYDITAWAKRIPLTVFVFDILFLDGKSLLDLPFSKRRALLEKVVKGKEDGIRLTNQIVTDEPKIIEKELARNVAAGLEGLVAKKTDAAYQAGARSFHWIKFKATSAALEKLRVAEGKFRQVGLLDTVDCVVMGASSGRGQRAAFGFGSFLLGVLGRDSNYYTVSNLGSGLSEEQFVEINRRIKKLIVAQKPKEYLVAREEEPDTWLRPALVLEVLAEEITLSPRHTAGKTEAGRGFSLRFPRLVRFRDDKNPEQATTINEVITLFNQRRER